MLLLDGLGEYPQENLKNVLLLLNLEAVLMENYEAVELMVGG